MNKPVPDADRDVTASGGGPSAEGIAALARDHGIPMYEDPGLVETLARLDAATLIPRELYAVVAEVLAFVYAVDLESAKR